MIIDVSEKKVIVSNFNSTQHSILTFYIAKDPRFTQEKQVCR